MILHANNFDHWCKHKFNHSVFNSEGNEIWEKIVL